MKQGLTELVFILDRSGSMAGLEADTIGGFNAMLAKQQALEGECRITTVLFNQHNDLLHDRIDMRAVSPMDDKSYRIGGGTALLDAIGLTIHKIGKAQQHTAETFRADKVLFVIITDGEENSSRLYTIDQVRGLIERQKFRWGWEFVYLGANIDAIGNAGDIGIAPQMALDYLSDSQGTRLNYDAMSEAVAGFRRTGQVAQAPLDKIRRDRMDRVMP